MSMMPPGGVRRIDRKLIHPTSGRDCMKKGCRRVVRYSSRYEKTLPNRSLRCRVEVHRASHTRTQRAWTTEDHSPREILDAIFYVLRSGCQWRMLPHDFPRWPTVYHYFRTWRIETVLGRRLTGLCVNAYGLA